MSAIISIVGSSEVIVAADQTLIGQDNRPAIAIPVCGSSKLPESDIRRQFVPQVAQVESNWQNHFSERECEVLVQLAQGKNNREISQILHLTEGTVKNYISRILEHLELRNRTQAALWAQRQLIHSQN
jgi:DNA-binding NarL/FixJ family response regulator